MSRLEELIQKLSHTLEIQCEIVRILDNFTELMMGLTVGIIRRRHENE